VKKVSVYEYLYVFYVHMYILVNFYVCRRLCDTPAPLISSLALSCHSHLPRLGFIFLHYLHHSHHSHQSCGDHTQSDNSSTKNYFEPYQEMVSIKEDANFNEMLLGDLKVLLTGLCL